MILPFHSRTALPDLLRAHGVRRVVNAGAAEMGALLERAGLEVVAVDRFPANGAGEAAARICSGPEAPRGVWLDGDLSYRGMVESLGAWADALPDGSVLAGAGYVRTVYRNGGLPVWANVPDAIAGVRRTRPFLTEPLLTWNEGWPSWLMFKRERVPTVEILSAATPDTPWWPEVEAHHRRYAARHGYGFEGRTMPAPADRSPVWLKFALMLERLRDGTADWLFWLDGDAVFWDFSRPLHGYVPSLPWDGVFPQFWRGRDCLSTGAFLLRRGEAARQLLARAWDQGGGGGYSSEEMRLADLAPGSAVKLLLTDHRDINSVPTGGIWHGGGRDFILHVAYLKEGRTEILRDMIARAEDGGPWPAAHYASQERREREVHQPGPSRAAAVPPPPPPLPHGFAA